MTQFKRLFSTDIVKGTRNYIKSQKKYEILRTLIYFFLSLSLFVAGYITTKSRENLLTVVAVVGCLPACKSLIGAIMFLRYKSCPKEAASEIEDHMDKLHGLYDMVFTSEKRNFVIDHLVVHGSNICGYSTQVNFPEKEFQTHMDGIMKSGGIKNYTFKVFTDLQKYTDRLDQLNALDAENKNITHILDTLKSVAL